MTSASSQLMVCPVSAAFSVTAELIMHVSAGEDVLVFVQLVLDCPSCLDLSIVLHCEQETQ